MKQSYVTCNRGAKSAEMSEPEALSYAILLGMMGNYNIRVHEVKKDDTLQR